MRPVAAALVVVLVATSVATSPASAHHSQAAYDLNSEVLIAGTLVDVSWTNPHIYLTVETAGADGSPVMQQVEVGPLAAVRTYGLTRDDLPEGAAVTVRARPNRRGGGRTVLGLDITMADGAIHPLSAEGRSSAPRPVATTQADGIAGNWVPNIDDFTIFLERLRNEAPPLSEAGLAARAAAPGPVAWTTDCTPAPAPPLTILPFLRTIEVGQDQVRMRFDAEGVDTLRIVHLGMSAHPDGVEPTLQGHSIGWWEGETFVIDTVAFAPHHFGILPGVPSSPGKHAVERLTLTENRRQLRYELSLEDPEYLTEPFVVTALWDHRPDVEPSEVACDVETARRFLEEE